VGRLQRPAKISIFEPIDPRRHGLHRALGGSQRIGTVTSPNTSDSAKSPHGAHVVDAAAARPASRPLLRWSDRKTAFYGRAPLDTLPLSRAKPRVNLSALPDLIPSTSRTNDRQDFVRCEMADTGF
jgi:hypothetical protein